MELTIDTSIWMSPDYYTPDVVYKLYIVSCTIVVTIMFFALSRLVIQYLTNLLKSPKTKHNPFISKRKIAGKKGDKIAVAYFWIRSVLYISEEYRFSLSLFMVCGQIHLPRGIRYLNEDFQAGLFSCMFFVVNLVWLLHETRKLVQTQKRQKQERIEQINDIGDTIKIEQNIGQENINALEERKKELLLKIESLKESIVNQI